MSCVLLLFITVTCAVVRRTIQPFAQPRLCFCCFDVSFAVMICRVLESTSGTARRKDEVQCSMLVCSLVSCISLFGYDLHCTRRASSLLPTVAGSQVFTGAAFSQSVTLQEASRRGIFVESGDSLPAGPALPAAFPAIMCARETLSGVRPCERLITCIDVSGVVFS